MEKLALAATLAFNSLAGFKTPVAPATTPSHQQSSPQPSPFQGEGVTAKAQRVDLQSAPTKGTKVLRLTGYVTLRGSEWINRGSSWVRITVYGYTQLRDQDGHYLRGDIRVEDTHTYYLSGSNYVSDWAQPYAYIKIYDGERLLGTTRIEGNIHVSGFKNGDRINLDGSGYVDGSLTYQEADPPKP